MNENLEFLKNKISLRIKMIIWIMLLVLPLLMFFLLIITATLISPLLKSILSQGGTNFLFQIMFFFALTSLYFCFIVLKWFYISRLEFYFNQLKNIVDNNKNKLLINKITLNFKILEQFLIYISVLGISIIFYLFFINPSIKDETHLFLIIICNFLISLIPLYFFTLISSLINKIK